MQEPEQVDVFGDLARTGLAGHAEITAVAQSIPFKADLPVSPASMAGAWLILIFLLAAAVVTVLVSRRRRAIDDNNRVKIIADIKPIFLRGWRTSSARQLSLVESRTLRAGHSLHVVTWQGNTLLLGCSGTSMQVLAKAMCAGGSNAAAEYAETDRRSTES